MIRKLALALATILVCWFAAYVAQAAEIQAPTRVAVGTEVTLRTTGNGTATFYLIGPGHVEKRQVRAGEDIRIAPESVRAAGAYEAVLSQGGQFATAQFFAQPAKPAGINFLARPSRVPVARQDVISGVAFVFDDYRNLILAPTPVKFGITVGDAPAIVRTEMSKNGIAWAKLNSARKAGAAQFVAAVDETQVRRVVQQVASDPCNLRMKAQRTDKAIVVETDPVRDCSGNPVPDGTIVTFTQVDAGGRSTVDARIKRGIAKADLPLADSATISVASGVVLGNEIHVGGGR